ncbi:hypothetical protein LIER_23173 [Lithospermum erythrorhizon]|uniref:Uncharacterized protein n=1 Tax=Lithospermum erythrorhizon TaxID=34254 RepID=A0AAV3QYT0_LITER
MSSPLTAKGSFWSHHLILYPFQLFHSRLLHRCQLQQDQLSELDDQQDFQNYSLANFCFRICHKTPIVASRKSLLLNHSTAANAARRTLQL